MDGVSGKLVWVLLVMCSSWRITAVHAQQAARTDPIEVAALEAILGRWGRKTSPLWEMTDEPCYGVAVDDNTDLDGNPKNNPGIKCDCSGTVCHITKLRVYALNVVGQIPTELQNLTYLTYLYGPLPKELGNLTNLNLLGISLTNLTGELPEELGNLTKLQRLFTDSAGLSGPFPSTFSKLKNLKLLRASDNDFTGKIPDYIGSLTNLEDLAFQGNSFEGPIPASLSNLTKLTTFVLRNCKISGDLGAVDFSKFKNLTFLFLGNNSLTGGLPDGISPSLTNLDFSYNQLTGSFPSWGTQNNLQLNLVANNFVLGNNNNGILPPGLNCLQKDTPCFRDYSFAVDCGSNRSIRGSDNTMYEMDSTNLGDSSYYVTSQTRWGVSNVGKLFQAPNDSKIIYINEKIQNAVDSELFQTARMSPSSLRYFGLGLENGNYTVLLKFAELGYPDSPTWKSLGRRVFDIYIQGELKEKDFNIRKTAGGKSFTAVYKSYTTTVSKNFLEIHLFWAGKGTCCVPIQGYYGPLISALSVTPNFTPTVRNGVPKKKSKAGAIVGIVIAASVLGSAILFGIFMVIKKRRRMAQQQEELYNLVGQPDVFSNAELKLATDNFSSQNILGEGGYGPVYKGVLPDGRVIAVKQLSQSSHQGKSQFVTEVATISAVQHRNLVKLHGCCIDSNTPLLVYEYLKNGSLDKALFGNGSIKLDWATRFEIILGIARGLTYLHEESSVRIVHRDIKASNVLLDTDLIPKISDFGLAKLYDEKKTHVSTGIAGTFGYLAPEYAMRRHLTEKVDVFAFGVIALEIVAGRSNTNNSLEESKIYLFEWAWSLYEKEQALGIVDPTLQEFNRHEVFRVIQVSLLCTQGSPHQRPPMSKVVAMLTGDVEVAEVVTKPSYITEWQFRGGNSSYVTSSYSGSTTPDFSRQKEIDPLTQSPTITGASHEHEGSVIASAEREREMGGVGVGGHLIVWVLLLVCSWRMSAAQAQQPPRTDPVEVAALEAILGRWDKKTSPLWSMSGEPCRGVPVDGVTGLDGNPKNNPGIKCDCSYINGTVCHITQLRVYALNVVGQIPAELQNLTYLNYLHVGFNALSGPIPKELGNLTNLNLLGISLTNFTGQLPEELGNLTKLQRLYTDSAGLSGPFPSTFSKLKNLKLLRASDNDFTGKIPDYIGSLTNLEDLAFQGNSFEGPIPASLSNLTKLTTFTLFYGDIAIPLVMMTDMLNTMSRRIGDICIEELQDIWRPWSSRLFKVHKISLPFFEISCEVSVTLFKYAVLWHRDLSFNNISGHVPQSILNLQMLTDLFLGNNSLTGDLPDGISPSLTNLYRFFIQPAHWKLSLLGYPEQLAIEFGGKQLCSWQHQQRYSTSRAKLPPERHSMFTWFSRIADYSFAVDCGSNRSIRGLDNTMYELDFMDLGDSSYYVTSQTRWGVSNVGKLFQAPNDSKIIYSNAKIQNAVDPELLQTARMSPSSLRYYGLGLENGNYTVLLQFAELGYPDSNTWKSLGRRVFDIYIQGDLKEKDFNIRKMAGGRSFTAVYKSYTAIVSKNFLEIHLFWAGKGTCCIPIQGYYGPLISAISITPNFTPTVRNGVPKRKSKAGAIAGILIGASVVGLAVLFGIFMVIKKRRILAQQQGELYNLVGRPDVFSNAELKLATNNFSSQNILGEGGYGPVYKGKLPDGRVIAVKQLSQSSHQGKNQFVTEVATISSVQHRNLVKLHGCCIDSNTPLLVYEYLENGSLDQALFRKNSLKLDWATRFEIILGIARGLTYLHEESSVRIVHRDIKASNVLLDTDLTPKISDFGLARLYDEKKTHVSTGIAGTFGYLAPEYAMRRHLTEKVDVYAFGVVALETVAGRSNTSNSIEESKIYLLEWAWDLYEKEQAQRIVDPRLEDSNKDEVLRVIHVALLCTQGSPNQRPPMSKVMAVLTGDAEVVEMLTKPSYITEWQYRDGNSTYSESTTSEFSRQKEIDPLTQSPTITGSSHDGRSSVHGFLWPMLVYAFCAAVQAQQAARTDPAEVVALNTILGRWGLRASPAWNISGEPCSGVAIDETGVDNNPNINPAIKCDCSFNTGTVCHIIRLYVSSQPADPAAHQMFDIMPTIGHERVFSLNVVGQIPEELQNLTYLNNLYDL
uniref:non-specific serine/threonine protein kinase n=1 Tax=Oryza punctata TaxID=4537 RepID=A0A0E0LS96_ORYPU